MTWKSQFQSISMLHSFPFIAETKMIVQTSIYVSHVYCCHLVVSFVATNNSHYHTTTVACQSTWNHQLIYVGTQQHLKAPHLQF